MEEVRAFITLILKSKVKVLIICSGVSILSHQISYKHIPSLHVLICFQVLDKQAN